MEHEMSSKLYSIMQSQSLFYETQCERKGEDRMGGKEERRLCDNCIHDHVWKYYSSSAVSEHKASCHAVVLINCQLWFLPLYEV
jgi:hypothetical protein